MAHSGEMDMNVSEDTGGRFSRMSNMSSATSMFSKAAISQRIVIVEHYMAAPVKEFDNMYSDFRNSAVKRVPVIRIFGSTSAGQKMCANIHGVYPYISILFDETVDGFEYRVASALDSAINDCVNTNKFAKNTKGFVNSHQHVFKALRIVGRTFYGYRSDSEVFLRIFFYNPLMVKKAIDLLQSGSILGRRFQPYEAHIPYSLQFMIDYSLYGMNFAHYSTVKYRRNPLANNNIPQLQIEDLIPSSQGSIHSVTSEASFVDSANIPENLLGPSQLTKSTLCELEIDVIASDILIDTNSSGKAKSVNPGIDSIWKDEIERRRQHGVENSSQITIPESQERSQAELVHHTEDKYLQILWSKVQSYFDESSTVEEGEGDKSLIFETSALEELQTSSQIPDHLSVQSKKTVDESESQLSPEEDEFLKLLEEMAVNADQDQSTEAANLHGNLRNEMIEETEEDLLDECNNDDDVWDDSFLSSSILETISDAEISYKESRPPGQQQPENAHRSPVIFQCDGQANDSDESSSEKPSSSKPRRSPRKTNQDESEHNSQQNKNKVKKFDGSTSTEGKTDTKNTKRRMSSRVSTSNQQSPANRLSLTLRRKSKSQDTKSSTKNDSKELSRGKSNSCPTDVETSTNSNARRKSELGTATVKGAIAKAVNVKASDTVPRKAGGRPKKRKHRSNSEKVQPKESETSTPNKSHGSDHSSANQQAQYCEAILQSKKAVIYLTKIDAVAETATSAIASDESSNSKRTRRKPKWLLEAEDTSSPRSRTSISNPETKVKVENAAKSETSGTTLQIAERKRDNEPEAPAHTTVSSQKEEANSVSQGSKTLNHPDIKIEPVDEIDTVNEAATVSAKTVVKPKSSLLKKKRRLGTRTGINSPSFSKRATRKLASGHRNDERHKQDALKEFESVQETEIRPDPQPSFKTERTEEITAPEAQHRNTLNAKLLQAAEEQKQEVSKEKTFTDTGVTCKPPVKIAVQQTDQVLSTNQSVQVQPQIKEQNIQAFISSQNAETQTLQSSKKTIGTQTDVVESLCLCQCKCVRKGKADIAVDNQEELKPISENKRIQVNNADLIMALGHRQARYTTPQSTNKIMHVRPSRSPEKRRTYTESPRRRRSSSSSHHRYLSAVLKTPTSSHKYRSPYREYDTTPPTREIEQRRKTPPSKEEYMVDVIKNYIAHKSRRASIKPRNLSAEKMNRSDEDAQGDENRVDYYQVSTMEKNHSIMCDAEGNEASSEAPEVPGESHFNDFSVNSIYEYEDPSMPSQDVAVSLTQSEIGDDSIEAGDTSSDKLDNGASSPLNQEDQTPASETLADSPEVETPLSAFQEKRMISRSRSRIRVEKRKAANLHANKEIPDVFEVEFEPLKQPPSYRSIEKWLDSEKHRPADGRTRHGSKNKNNGAMLKRIDNNSSDEEEAPPPVKLFGGGNMSDGDNSDEEGASSCMSINTHRAGVKAFTPPSELVRLANEMEGNGSNVVTPRSILRPRGSSRRQSGIVLKRKIRWDVEPENESGAKRLRLTMSDTNENSWEPLPLSNESYINTGEVSELDGPTFKNALGLEDSMSNFQDVKALQQCQFVTTMCVELHCASRDGLTPDPALDPIVAMFIYITSDYPDNFRRPKEGMNILFLEDVANNGTAMPKVENNQCMKAFSNEVKMIEAFIALVKFWDPDMLVGYEVEKFSFGYIIQRGFHLGKEMTQELSRVFPLVRNGQDGQKEPFFRRKEEWNGTINGRIVLNLWRLLRHEIAVQSYSFENAAYHILRRRVYKYSHKDLNTFWMQKTSRIKVIQYYTVRIKGAIQIMEKLDLINRTSELARLFGIQFYEVLSRGSQFRVESMMLRATKPLDFVAPSPTVTQRAKMRAPEYLPLIMEPRSSYYTDPVAVLDFQSLYPSMMIAYNYDYASLLGRVEHLGGLDRFPIGCLDHYVHPGELLRLKDHIHVSPAGVAFLDKSVIKGILPEMLEQILDTRQMVKRAMKRWKNEGASLKKVLDSRQLGLKLIANVTYGYTSANFSGRMPCVEVADSIVSKGRETLQRAIDLVTANYNRWGGEVIYGDTDSMFVLFRGKSRDEAFKLAYEMADEVTRTNPKPVKLKFEKIYQPCILQSKKRYVGYAYETPDQEEPIYDAKGIETVRRDGCPAVRKILEKTLHILFRSNDPAKVENYVKLQFEKLFKGRVSMQDYIFAREYRGRDGYKPTACVPALEIAKKLTEVDPKAEPLTKERVPYVVIYGDPNLQLIRLVRRPEEYLQNSSLRLNAHYYIEKVIIPALNRCLRRAKLDASKWYLQMPRKFLRNVLDHKPAKQRTLDDYILHQNCFRCDARAEHGLCDKCQEDRPGSVIYLSEVVNNSKQKLSSCAEICTNCAGESGRCVSIDCPVLHKLTRYQRDEAYMKTIERYLMSLEW